MKSLKEPIVLILISALFVSCSLNLNQNETSEASDLFYENVTFNFPDISIFTENSEIRLSKWKVTYGTYNKYESFFLSPETQSYTFSAEKNIPLFFMAAPVVEIYDSSTGSFYTLSDFFKPCGAVYPFSYNPDTATVLLTWENGFTASVFNHLVLSKKETCLTDQHLLLFIKAFNWNKFMETLLEKSSNSCQEMENCTENAVFYNPWNLDLYSILDNLSNLEFSVSYLNQKSVFSFNIENSSLAEFNNIYSSYIPEIEIIKKYNKIFTLKNSDSYFLCDSKIMLKCNYSSSKKISLEYICLPILN